MPKLIVLWQFVIWFIGQLYVLTYSAEKNKYSVVGFGKK